MMSRMLIRLVVIAILASPFALAACSSPKAVIDSAIFDVGEMPQGQKIIHTFILKNTGKGDLTYKVKPC